MLKVATDGYIRRQKGMKIVHRIPRFRTYLFCETKLDSIASIHGTRYTRTFSLQTTQLQIDKDCDLLKLK